MRAHVIENNRIINTILVEALDQFPGLRLIDASLGGVIGDSYDEDAGEVAAAPPAPTSPPLVPQEVTMRQARLALRAIGKLDQVAPAIESLGGTDRDVARIEWEFSSTVVRSRALVVMLGQALGLNDEALDQLFITAAGL